MSVRLVCVVGPPRVPVVPPSDTPVETTIREVNEEILAQLGGSWKDPPIAPAGWQHDASLGHARRLAERLAAEEERLIVVDDPLTALTLPFWDEVATVVATAVVVTYPDDVIRHLVDDEQMEADRAAALWLRYLVTAWRDAPARVPVTTSRLRAGLDEVTGDLAGHVGAAVDLAAIREALLRTDISHTPRVGHVIEGHPVVLARAVRQVVEDVREDNDEHLDAIVDELHRGWVLAAQAAASDASSAAASRSLEAERERTRALEEKSRHDVAQVDAIEARWRAVVEKMTERERAAVEELRGLRTELRRAQERAESVMREYQRLRRSRSVRLAVALADALRPLVEAVRRARRWSGRRKTRGPSVESVTQDARVFTVILNYKHAEDAIGCVGALERSTMRNQFFVVVDNGSGQETVDALRRGLATRHLIDVGDNLGYAAGNNVGIRYALERDADFVWIINPDVRVESEALDRLVRTMIANPDAGIVGGRLLNGGTNPLTIASDGGTIDWPQGGATDHLHVGARDRDVAAGSPYSVDYVPGACMLVRRAVFDDVGLLPEQWFLYFEETDFNLRVRDAGWRTLVDPSARIHHHKRSSGRVPSPYYVYYFVRNRLLFARRHADGWDESLPPDLERWLAAWRDKVERADVAWGETFDRLVDLALTDARAGTTGRRADIEDVAPAGGSDV